MTKPIRRWGQVLNFPGFTLPLFYLATRPSRLIPHFQIHNISGIDFEAARDLGIVGVVYDKDNTLTDPLKEEGLHPRIEEAFEKSKDVFGSQNIYINSNSVGTVDDPGYFNAQELEVRLGVRVFRHGFAKKPAGLRALRRQLEHTPSRYLVVGDRVTTDILFGNRAGAITVLVDKFTDEGDLKGISGIRRTERRLVAKLHSKGIRAPYQQCYGQNICPNATFYGLHE